jgi:integrase
VAPTRRSKGSDGISFEHRGPCTDAERHRHCPGRWVGQVWLGYKIDASGKRTRDYRRVYGKTKTAVTDKLKELHDDLDKGIKRPAGTASYTVRQAAEDWLREGLKRAPKTIRKNQDVLEPILAVIGEAKLRELTAGEVGAALEKMAQTYSSSSVTMGHLALKRAIRYAEARDRVGRNVATLTDTPAGQDGRPSKSLTVAQAVAVISAARALPEIKLHPGLQDHRRPAELMYAYVVLSLMVGVRTEEARALRWDHVYLDAEIPHVAVWRSVRARGDTKTRRSRRTLALPQLAVEALRALLLVQADERLAAGVRWADSDLVFTTATGTALDAGNVRKMFKRICTEAGIGEDWTPRELRTSFVSILSEQGVAIEEIARLVGHAGGSTVTETIYRQELRPVIQTTATVMDNVFAPEPRRIVRRRAAKKPDQ